jgi:hypothetical protein
MFIVAAADKPSENQIQPEDQRFKIKPLDRGAGRRGPRRFHDQRSSRSPGLNQYASRATLRQEGEFRLFAAAQ